MCGITGYWLARSHATDGARLLRMSAVLAHRGPDDEGFAFLDPATDTYARFAAPRSPATVRAALPLLTPATAVPPHRMALAQTRYAVVDLSPGGHQPLWSADDQAAVIFNGEIYNHVELRTELAAKGHAFRTTSDTEVLLAAYREWGDQVFHRLYGFFAIVIYDRRRRGLLLGRDRFGKAHLYVARTPAGDVYWASEIKAFFAGGCADPADVAPSAITDFILYQRRDRGGTFWRSIEDFPPAHYAWLDDTGAWNPQRYWDFPARRLAATDLPEREAVGRFTDKLLESLRLRLRADVPIAFELSGGLDSSALVALAAGRLGLKVKAYTVAFTEAHANEEPYARAVAEHYPGLIDYHVLRPPPDTFWQDADRFVWMQEEPFHAPNLHANQLLRRQLKQDGAGVVITGAAGDELLAGYPGTYDGPFLRHLLAHGRFGEAWRELRASYEIPPSNLVKGATWQLLLSEERLMRYLLWRAGEMPLLRRVLPPAIRHLPPRRPSDRREKTFHGMLLANMTHRLMNYWLRSSTKADYGIPIECRTPFLDTRLCAYACRLPPEYLIHNGWHKYILRLAVADLLPESVVWRRRKMGFPFPYREWLRHNRAVIARNLADSDCPHIHAPALFAAYDDFIRTAPVTLWRLVSVLLWWRRVVNGQPLHAGA